MTDPKDPCGNEDCDRCYPLPRWKVSQRRVQVVTYEREIKATTQDEAKQIFAAGTAWPSSYDDKYGDVIDCEDVEVKSLPLQDDDANCCWHNLTPLSAALV